MARFAAYDPAQADPKTVLGWWDTEVFQYDENTLPPTERRLLLTDEEWDRRLDNYYVISGGHLVAHSLPPSPSVSDVPVSVSIVQATLALHRTPGSAPERTLLDDVNAAVDASTDPEVKLAWQRATMIDRNGLFVQRMSSALGWDAAKLDALFVAAAAISV